MVEVAAATDIGCVRKNNEDNFGYDRRHGIYTVCDGMGGEAAGEVASKIAVDTLLAYFDEAAKTKAKSGVYPVIGKIFEGVSERANALASAIQLANHTIQEAGAANASQTGMGSTLTAVLVEGTQYSIAHVGDSRIYLLRPGASSIQQLTGDHSLVMEQVRRGLITLEQVQHSDLQNIILRALGCEETVEPDLDDLEAAEGDVLLLTTDGLTRHLPDEQILEIVKAAPTLQQACHNLIQAAKNAGGQDNITCLLLRWADRGWIKGVFAGQGKNRETGQGE